MLRFLGQLQRVPVFAQRLGQPIGTVNGWVLDPAKGKVEAYRVQSGGSKYLSTIDVTTYLDDAIVVSDRDVLQPAGELVRIKALLEEPTKLFGLKVVTEQGDRLGKVRDALIETNGHFIAKLYLKPGWLGRVVHQERIIPREQVLRIEPKRVVVRYDRKAPATPVEPEVA